MSLADKITKANFKKTLEKLGYAYFTKGSFNLNIIGVRSKARENNNVFDDFIVVEYYNDDRQICKYIFPATTNPGVYYLQNPLSKGGCAIVVPGQYRGAYTFGKHQGKYDALVQKKPIKIYRDVNRDTILDMDKNTIQSGIFGINIHKAGADSSFVSNWSAGCQVFKRAKDFDTFMCLCRLQSNNLLGNTFTYTLIDEDDLVV